jgi:hypothetical protein
MNDLHGWRIVPEALPRYQAGGWEPDCFQELGQGKYGVYFYDITEARMMDYYGRVAVFANPAQPLVLLQSATVWATMLGTDSVQYLSAPDCLLFRMPAYVEHTTKPTQPFVFLNFTHRLFAFVAWNESSRYYHFQALDHARLQVLELDPQQLARHNAPRRTGEVIHLSALRWYPLEDFDAAVERYQQEK